MRGIHPRHTIGRRRTSEMTLRGARALQPDGVLLYGLEIHRGFW